LNKNSLVFVIDEEDNTVFVAESRNNGIITDAPAWTALNMEKMKMT